MSNLSIRFNTLDTVADWKTVDDVVMGGKSNSSLEWRDIDIPVDDTPRGALSFRGDVNLDGGGFCSARTEWSRPRDCSGASRVRLVVRGDGKQYRWTIRTPELPAGASLRHPFQPGSRDWQTIELPLSAFAPWRRGTRLDIPDSSDFSAVESIGILIADKQEGPFELDIAAIDLT